MPPYFPEPYQRAWAKYREVPATERCVKFSCTGLMDQKFRDFVEQEMRWQDLFLKVCPSLSCSEAVNAAANLCVHAGARGSACLLPVLKSLCRMTRLT